METETKPGCWLMWRYIRNSRSRSDSLCRIRSQEQSGAGHYGPGPGPVPLGKRHSLRPERRAVSAVVGEAVCQHHQQQRQRHAAASGSGSSRSGSSNGGSTRLCHSVTRNISTQRRGNSKSAADAGVRSARADCT